MRTVIDINHACEYMTGGRVVVLGPTGRNFDAGMSGGIAFIYDTAGDFASRLNREMVDLDPLDPDDIAWLRDRVEQHLAETGSSVAGRLLDNWDLETSHFVKVMPKDYKRVLAAQRKAEAEGSDPIEAIMAASRV